MFRGHGPKIPDKNFHKILFPLARRMGIFDYAHAFSNYPVEKWIDMFRYISKHKNDLHLHITGGEPLLFYRELSLVANFIVQHFDNVNIRVDTNGSITPEAFGVDRKYISFNVSYHPTGITLDKLFVNLKKLARIGNIVMVNRVYNHGTIKEAEADVEVFKGKGYFLNVAIEDNNVRDFDEEALNVVKKFRSKLDYMLPIVNENIGKKCCYPTFGFELLPNGYSAVKPCAEKHVRIINKPEMIWRLLSAAPILCPAKCTCLHQYPWVADGYRSVNILEEYVKRNTDWREMCQIRSVGEIG